MTSSVLTLRASPVCGPTGLARPPAAGPQAATTVPISAAAAVVIRRALNARVGRMHSAQEDVDEGLPIRGGDALAEEDVEGGGEQRVLVAGQELRVAAGSPGVEEVPLSEADHRLVDQWVPHP